MDSIESYRYKGNSSASEQSNTSEVLRDQRQQTLIQLKINEEAVENNTGKLQDKICYENWVKTEELNNPALLHDDHEILDD